MKAKISATVDEMRMPERYVALGVHLSDRDPRATAQVRAALKDTKAIGLLDAYVARAGSQDADAQNWLGYANRKAGNLPAAFTHYERALALNPKHRGVHEYMGEAYLMANNLPKAEEHLKTLDGLCFFSCEEYRELKASIDSYKAKHASLGSAK